MRPAPNPPTVLSSAIAAAVCLSCSAGAGSQLINVDYDEPTFDRWMYAFNPTPGMRGAASTFGAFGNEAFDNRDAQFYIAFDTSADVAPGMGAASYIINSAQLTIAVENSATIFYDNTLDPFNVFLSSGDPAFMEDRDPGQPMELFGAGFRNDFTAQTFGETGPFAVGDPLIQGVRTAYALGFNDEGDPIDVSLSVDELFNPVPFAIGVIDALESGDLVLTDDEYVFEIDVNDANVQMYIATALDEGILPLMVTSLHLVEPMGGDFPAFYTKENILAQIGAAQAPRLVLEVEIVDDPGNPFDLNMDGVVSGPDLLILLNAWGACSADEGTECPADFDGSGAIGGGDLLMLLNAWG